ncbi:hypothetical protein [Massilia sp. Root1485]|uniref:hypothetical protein n=1 Tax=Massilia sp. Root1485 TaxID=1736472 RepID=UPI0006F93CB5|nr:hypothetical protein [Massilia sp. Root1485]KQZ46358.1 hypothetical protein ASD92_25965 [Massilia sp. Root1485]
MSDLDSDQQDSAKVGALATSQVHAESALPSRQRYDVPHAPMCQPAQAVDAREFVLAVAHNFDAYSEEDDERYCRGCSALLVIDGPKDVTNHQHDCIVPRAKAWLAASPAAAPDAAHADDGDVTEAMIQAGIAALTLTAQTAPNAELAVTTLYRAMHDARAAAVSPSDAKGKADGAELEYRTCCEHPGCTTCAGRGGFYRIGTKGKADAANAGGLSAFTPTEQQYAEWCERHDLPDHLSREAFDDAVSLYLTGTSKGQSPAASEADASELLFNATRLRNVARLVGLESAVPQDDATLDGARGSVLGMIAGKLHTASATSATDEKDAERKPLAHGHREDWYLLANARRVAEKPIHAIRTMPNWVLASELFATGCTAAHQICRDADIDPDGYKIQRTPMAASGKGGAK